MTASGMERPRNEASLSEGPDRDHPAPRITVLEDENQPPVPLTQQISAPGTWRLPASPLSWRVASTSRNMPRMPG